MDKDALPIGLSLLPLSAEPLEAWDSQSDLLAFLYAVNDQDGTLLLPTGKRELTSYRNYGLYAFEAGKSSWISHARAFSERAGENLSANTASHETTAPDFLQSPGFGQVAKYAIAFDGAISASLSAGTFFSIAHILESLNDLQCSIHLAQNLYYKQALQTLRSFLEDVVLPVHFADNPRAYGKWKSNKYRTPPLRGKRGLLANLVGKNIIAEELAERISLLYGDLNEFVHGQENRLTNKGQYTRTWTGHSFVQEEFDHWRRAVVEAVTLGIELLQINLDQWHSLSGKEAVLCIICHNTGDFESSSFRFGGEQFVRYRCMGCGDDFTQGPNGRQAYAQSLEGVVVSYQY